MSWFRKAFVEKLVTTQHPNGILGWMCRSCGREFSGLDVPLDEVCPCRKQDS